MFRGISLRCSHFSSAFVISSLSFFFIRVDKAIKRPRFRLVLPSWVCHSANSSHAHIPLSQPRPDTFSARRRLINRKEREASARAFRLPCHPDRGRELVLSRDDAPSFNYDEKHINIKQQTARILPSVGAGVNVCFEVSDWRQIAGSCFIIISFLCLTTDYVDGRYVEADEPEEI